MDLINLSNDKSLIEEINVGELIQILEDIRLVKEAFPNIEIAAKSNYRELKVSMPIRRYGFKAEIKLSYDETNWIIKSHNLPEKAAQILKVGSAINLKSAVDNFILLVNRNLSNYFEALYILDLNCIVLEPHIRSMDTNWRLIKYSKFAFIKIEFPDPLHANDFKVTFFGKDHVVRELNKIYDNSSNEYDDDEIDIYQKLCIRLKIFEFPYTNRIEDTDECSICLCHRNDKNEETPIVCCENPKCYQLFHGSCLNQHLNINSYKILSISVGECPFCKMKISSNFAGLINQMNVLKNVNEECISDSNDNKMETN